MSKDVIIYTDVHQKMTYYQRDTKSPTIYVYFRKNGKTYRFSTGTTSLPDAMEVAGKKKHLVSKGKSIKKTVFKKLLHKYLEYQKPRVTLGHYQGIERNGKLLVEYFGNRDLNTNPITNKTLIGLEKWRRDYYKKFPEKVEQTYIRKGKKITGRKFNTAVSNRSINSIVKLAVSIMRHAVKNEIVSGIAPQYTALKENKRESIIDEVQLKTMYDHFLKEDKEFCAFVVVFCFYTGVRYPSESYDLIWKDIDFERKSILIRNRKNKSKVVNTSVPMLPPTENILRKLEQYQGDKEDKDYVFRTKNGKRIRSITKSFKRAVKELDFDPSLTMYSLRHSFITHLVENYRDIPLKMIADVAGHSDTRMVENVYGHLREDITINAFTESHTSLVKSGKISSVDFDKGTKVTEFLE